MREMITEWLEAITEVKTEDLEDFFYYWIEAIKATLSGEKQDIALSIIDLVKKFVIAKRKAHN